MTTINQNYTTYYSQVHNGASENIKGKYLQYNNQQEEETLGASIPPRLLKAPNPQQTQKIIKGIKDFVNKYLDDFLNKPQRCKPYGVDDVIRVLDNSNNDKS